MKLRASKREREKNNRELRHELKSDKPILSADETLLNAEASDLQGPSLLILQGLSNERGWINED
jgi:hypothetical protein